MKWRPIKYFMALLVPYSVIISFLSEGVGSFHAIFVTFGLIPLLELFIKPDPKNLSAIQQEIVQKDKFYDLLLYVALPLQYILLLWFLFLMRETEISSLTFWGRVSAFGLLCGVMGINVAHELGHRPDKFSKLASKALLLSTLYPHFYIEHNFGHHKNVGTPMDAATAKYNESIYKFWLRSIFNSYLSAWKIENQRIKRSGKNVFFNEMILYLILKSVLLLAILYFLGWKVLLAYVLGATIGILLLESVNYIEHYGLQRKRISTNRFEDTGPEHSWNSNHILGRLILFELTRHSDHHANPSRKYQALRHFDESPQLPSGYPGMILLALVPPLWFSVINKKIGAQNTSLRAESKLQY